MEPPREKVSYQGISMSKVRCTSNPKPETKYCGKHAGWDIHDAILARGAHVCSSWDTRRCSNEAGGAKQRCQACRDTGNQGEASLREKKLAKARATLKDGEKTCYGKCCRNHLLSQFVSAQGTKTEHCQGCRASQDVREKRRKGKQMAQRENGVVTERLQKAREYDKSEPRQVAKKARKEANPELSKDYQSKYSAAKRNIDHELTPAQMETMRRDVCFYCHNPHDYHKMVLSHLDPKVGYTVDNTRPSCRTCTEMKGCLDATTFVERCAYLTVREDGGAAEYPQSIYAEHPVAGDFLQYQVNAGKAGRAFDLTREGFEAVRSKPCYVCGKTDRQGFHRNGVDRVDSAVGYTEDNVAACCGECNSMKKAMSIDAFKARTREMSGQSAAVALLSCNIARSLTCVRLDKLS
jgi:hypothetical protein